MKSHIAHRTSYIHKVLLLVLMLGIVMPSVTTLPLDAAPTTAQQKAKAKAQKKRDKAKAKKQKAKDKKQKEKDEAEAKKQKAKDKVANQRQKEQDKKAAEKQRLIDEKAAEVARKEKEEMARDEANLRLWERSQGEPVLHLFNLNLKAGYAGLIDAMPSTTTGTTAPARAKAVAANAPYSTQLLGGPGAGLGVTYELQYKHLRFETGLDFNYLASWSRYGFNATRTDNTYGAIYNYHADRMTELRQVGYIGLPVMAGAQFDKFYFLLGAKVGYGLFANYSQKGQYDITVHDPALLQPYGLGTYDLAPSKGKFTLAQPDLRLCAEVGLDLDDWLHKDADPKKKKKKVAEGERQPFGREYIHYKVGLFAEYGVLNTNGHVKDPVSPDALVAGVAANDPQIQMQNSMLAAGGKLGNLFVGLRFAVQFQIPGITPEMPSSYADIIVRDRDTREVIPSATVTVSDIATQRYIMRNRKTGAQGIKQKLKFAKYQATAMADKYQPSSQDFEVNAIGHLPVEIYLLPKPEFQVNVYDRKTGRPLRASVEVRQRGTQTPHHALTTDSVEGHSSVLLEDTIYYTVHIEQLGYEPFDAEVTSVDQHMRVDLIPVEKIVPKVYVLRHLFFATNKTRILPTSEEELQNLTNYLNDNPSVRIRIVGHTDNVGRDAANQKLSEGRANEVMKNLIQRGIDPARLEAEGRGESEPIDTNDTEEGRQNNRRVEVHVL